MTDTEPDTTTTTGGHPVRGCHGLVKVGAGPNRYRYPELADKEWLRARYVDQDLDPTAIARAVGCSVPAVTQALIRHRIFPKRGYPSQFDYIDGDQFLADYHEAGSTGALAGRYGVSYGTARKWLFWVGVNPRNHHPEHVSSAHRKRRDAAVEDVRAALAAHDGKASVAAAALGWDRRFVVRVADENGIPRVTQESTAERDVEILTRVVSGQAASDVAAQFGIHPAQVTRVLKRAGLRAVRGGGAAPINAEGEKS